MKSQQSIEEHQSSEVPRLVTSMAFIFSVGFVVFEGVPFEENALIVGICSAVFIVSLFTAMARINDRHKRDRYILWLSAIYWCVLLGLFLPVLSPLLAVSSFIVLMGSQMLQKMHAIALTLFVVAGSQLGYILGDEHSLSKLTYLGIHQVSLLLIVFIGAQYSSNKAAETRVMELQSEKATIEHERLQALINSMTDGVVATDIEGNVAIYNGSALDILNVNASLGDMNIQQAMNVIDTDGQAVDIMGQAKSHQGYLVSRDYLLSVAEFENINLYISVSPVKIGFGKAGEEGFIMLLRDITREKSLEEERDEFISVVSHELRTPITIAEGNISNAQIIGERKGADAGVIESLDAAHKQVVFLADMINDLATLSRAERGNLQAQPEEIDIHDFIKGLQRDYRTSAQTKSLNFKTHVDKDIETITTSRLYLREILQNFITNAIKYTQEGDVTLNVTKKGQRLSFAVKDSGIGISKSDQKHLFKKFFRSEDYRTRENNGTGLGLYVTMKLAKMLNAQISVDSVINDGSTFTILIPSMKKEDK